VKKAVTDVVQYGRVMRPWLGVRYVMVTPALALERSLVSERGAILVKGAGDEPAVLPGSPAEAAGFEEGDVLVSINGESVGETRSLASLLSLFGPGEIIRVQIQRGEEAHVLEVTLGEVPLERLP
jgi:serine protease Do